MSTPLFQPFVIGKMSLANRIVMAPMTRCRADGARVPKPIIAEHYAQRAAAGLIVTEATAIAADAVGVLNTPGIWSEAQVAGWRVVTEAVHAKGGKIFCQLWHCGRSSHSSMLPEGKLPVSASAIAISNDHVWTAKGKVPYETPRALDASEIPGIVKQYGEAAKNAMAAGFDGVELHSANGYLIDQFLQSKTNQRTDAYGGTVEKRFRLFREVIEAIVAVWGADRVGARLSPNGVYNDMGSPDFREQFLYAAKELNSYPLAYLHVMDGLGFGFHKLGEALTLRDFRGVFKRPLMGNCGYTREAGDAAIAAGDADLVAYGRPYIMNPDLVERFAANVPLAESADMSKWYTNGPEGYIDYPTYK